MRLLNEYEIDVQDHKALKRAIRNLIFYAIVTAVLIGVSLTAVAGDKITQSNDMNNQTAGSIKGSNTIAVAGGDHDIGQCRYHVGGLTVAWTRNNEFCEGMELIKAGFIEAGVIHICKQTDVGKNYLSEFACINGMTRVVTPPSVGDVMEDIPDEDEEYNERIASLEQQLYDQRSQFEMWEERAARYAREEAAKKADQQAFLEQKAAEIAELRE